MSSNNTNEEHDPVANLITHPVRGILKSSKSIDDSRFDSTDQKKMSSINNYSTTGMTRSESKSHKIPHFDEMNIIATYHPVNKDYGHMKIEEPKTPYASGNNDEMDTDYNNDETASEGIDPDVLVHRLNESSIPSPTSSRLHINSSPRRSIDDNTGASSEDLEHRKHFESHRKQHYNEFEIVRLRKKEIEAELHALEQEEVAISGSEERGNEIVSSSTDSIKPILIHHHSNDLSSSPSSSHHHVHVEDNHDDDLSLTPEERERQRQFELKRKKHYTAEFRVAHSMDRDEK